MESQVVCLDIHALVIKDKPPVYRLYIDGYLMTERTFLADDMNSTYYAERSPIIVNSRPVCVQVEWVIPPLSYKITNIGIKDCLSTTKVLAQEKSALSAEIEYEDQ